MGLIEDALARQAAAPAPRPIDYDRMRRVMPKQKAALTRVVATYRRVQESYHGNPRRFDYDVNDAALAVARENIAKVCKAAVVEWNAIGAWPDNWHRWQAALDDALGWNQHIDLRDL